MITTTIITAISLAGVYVMFFWVLRSYQVDAFRQRMFALRDEWFDYADSGGISFEHAAYRNVRNMMNGHIRFAHRLDLGAVGFALAIKPEEKDALSRFGPVAALDAAMSDLDEQTKDIVKDFRRRMSVLVAGHIFLSPLAVVTVAPALAFLVVLRVNIIGARRLWAAWNRDIDMAALVQEDARMPHYR